MPFGEVPRHGPERPPQKRLEEMSPPEQLEQLERDRRVLVAWMGQPDANVPLDRVRLAQIDEKIGNLRETLGIKVPSGEGVKEEKLPSSESGSTVETKPKG